MNDPQNYYSEPMDLSTQMLELSKEIKEMHDDVRELKGYMERQNSVIEELMRGHEELLTRMVKQEAEMEEEKNMMRPTFPIMTQEDLDSCEEFIGKDERKKEELIRFLKPMLMPVGLKQKLVHVLSDNILMSYNLEGTHGKKRMLEYPKLLSVLYSATKRPGWSYKYFLEDVRAGIQYGKKKHFKSKYRAKMREMDSNQKVIKQNPLSDDGDGDGGGDSDS